MDRRGSAGRQPRRPIAAAPQQRAALDAARAARRWGRIAAAALQAAPIGRIVRVPAPPPYRWPDRFVVRGAARRSAARSICVLAADGSPIVTWPPLPLHLIAESLAALAREWDAASR